MSNPMDEALVEIISQLCERVDQLRPVSRDPIDKNDTYSQVMGEDRHGSPMLQALLVLCKTCGYNPLNLKIDLQPQMKRIDLQQPTAKKPRCKTRVHARVEGIILLVES